MSLELVSVIIIRSVRTHLGGGDYAETEQQIAGSPFLGRVYRAAQVTVGRDEAASGTATIDAMPRLAIYDPRCPVAAGMIALLPDPLGPLTLAGKTYVRAKITRVRGRYGDRVQCDMETGAEGDVLLNAAALGDPLPPTLSAQSQIDALKTQIGTLMATSLASAPNPIMNITATVALTRPGGTLQVYKVSPTANTVATLFAATGSGFLADFDVSALGGFTFGIALYAGDAYDVNNAGIAAQIAGLIAGGAASIPLRDSAVNVWHLE